jgi:GDPmannose 4,6-dehydratase
MKKALITGITGQDGSYLAEFLLSKGYEVHGLKRRTSSRNVARIEHLFSDNSGIESGNNLFLHHGDMTDSSSLSRVINSVMPDEIYNLAAQSHVKVSFEEPEYTANSDAIGPLRILEIIRSIKKPIKFYQASTSELFGGQSINQLLNEESEFNPRSPYAAAKLYAFHVTRMYREAYGIFAVNGILFNHESPRRGDNFVTKKIVSGIAAVEGKKQEYIRLGNLDAVRDWGHARDYVEAQWLMLQQEIPEDYVIATGACTSVRDFIRLCYQIIGVTVEFIGAGIDEVCRVTSCVETKNGFKSRLSPGHVVVKVDAAFFRPLEVDFLLGDPSNAMKKLGWRPHYDVRSLVLDMVSSEFGMEFE